MVKQQQSPFQHCSEVRHPHGRDWQGKRTPSVGFLRLGAGNGNPNVTIRWLTKVSTTMTSRRRKPCVTQSQRPIPDLDSLGNSSQLRLISFLSRFYAVSLPPTTYANSSGVACIACEPFSKSGRRLSHFLSSRSPCERQVSLYADVPHRHQARLRFPVPRTHCNCHDTFA
jgi:hypothetical protein